MNRGGALAVAVCVAVVVGVLPSVAVAEERVVITEAGFSPDVLGQPTNAFGSATITSTTGPVPSPIRHVDVYGPAGITLNLEGTGTCNREALEQKGPTACPADSRAGFGGGQGVYELGHEIVEEKYTIDFFLSNNQPGHVELLVYLTGSKPVSVEVTFTAKVINGPKPYGLGFSVEVPEIKVLPEASNASAKTAFLTLGAKNVAYYKTIHGKRTLVHVKGIILPKHCPKGGWPIATQITFEDGTTAQAKHTIPCPHH